MELPINRFKRAIQAGQHQLGYWNAIPSNHLAEVLAVIGYDWLLLDTEHSPVEPSQVLASLQAVAPYHTQAIVRPVVNDTALIKRYLDMGAQSLLIPFVQNADEARAAADAVMYPPQGVRGVSMATRANRFGKVQNYGQRAREEICLLVQVETLEALDNLEEIAAVEGVDGIFIGPSDLSASAGFIGSPSDPDAIKLIEGAVARIVKTGKPAGILTPNEELAARCIELGALFTAVGIDVVTLMRGAEAVRDRFRGLLAKG